MRPLSFGSTRPSVNIPIPPTFQALNGHSGYSNLDHNITINGVTATPDYIYKGSEAGASTWTASVGTILDIASTGTAPTLGDYTPFTNTADTAVNFNSGTVYQAATSTPGDIGLNDFMLEIVCQSTDAAAETIIAKGPQDGVTPGYNFLIGGTYTVKFQANNANGMALEATAVLSYPPNVWMVVHAFYDKSDTAATGCRVFVNGVSVATTTHTSDGYTLSGGLLTIGARSDFSLKASKAVAYVAQYSSASWFAGGATNTTDWTAFAKHRVAVITGVYPQRAAGAPNPTTMSRTSVATLDRIVNVATGERRLFYVGGNWPRLCYRKEAGKRDGYMAGYLGEVQSTNIAPYNTLVFNNWGQIRIGDTYDSGTTPFYPDSSLYYHRAALDTDGYEHGWKIDLTLTAATWTFSAFYRYYGESNGENRDHIWMQVQTITNCSAWFNIKEGRIATLNPGCSAKIENYGLGWYRCSITFVGTAAAHTIRYGSASQDGYTTHTALYGYSPGFWVVMPQVEQTPGPTSLIRTASVSVTRVEDLLAYDHTHNWSSGAEMTLSANSMMGNSQGPSSRTIVHLGDDSSNLMLNVASDGRSYFWSWNSGVNIQDFTENPQIADGYIHENRITMSVNDAKFYTDGYLVGTDISCTKISPNTGIKISRTTGQLDNSLISDVRLYNRKIT